MYTIKANNKIYAVSDHAAENMLIRQISEAMVIETLERGTSDKQLHGSDLYEYHFDEGDRFIIVQVVVNETQLIIITVIDDTHNRET